MDLSLRWVDESDLDRIAETRLRCYATSAKSLADYRAGVREDRRAHPGDYLLAEREGQAIGTATSLSLTMWVRGQPRACQGIAWVGTVRTARRGGEHGVASSVMRETIRRGREREQVVSALMPFRASFYEHFGYGLVERRVQWTIPLPILPRAIGSSTFRYYEPSDSDAVSACRQRQVEAGQCDIETTGASWANHHGGSEDGFEVVDRASAAGPVSSWMYSIDEPKTDRRVVRVYDHVWDSVDSLRRELAFLGSQRDQYGEAIMQLPADLPLNLLLRETQIPHRPVEHAAANARLITRMQVRILDHVRFLQDLKLMTSIRAGAVVAIRETEGNESKIRLDVAEGRSSANTSDASPDVECRDIEWAMIVCGAITATTAATLGMIKVHRPDALPALDALSAGPAPFCGEYF